jgi:hypothetical protein
MDNTRMREKKEWRRVDKRTFNIKNTQHKGKKKVGMSL